MSLSANAPGAGGCGLLDCGHAPHHQEALPERKSAAFRPPPALPRKPPPCCPSLPPSRQSHADQGHSAGREIARRASRLCLALQTGSHYTALGSEASQPSVSGPCATCSANPITSAGREAARRLRRKLGACARQPERRSACQETPEVEEQSRDPRHRKPAEAANSYTAADIEVLEGSSCVPPSRRCTLGGTDEKALHHLFARGDRQCDG